MAGHNGYPDHDFDATIPLEDSDFERDPEATMVLDTEPDYIGDVYVAGGDAIRGAALDEDLEAAALQDLAYLRARRRASRNQ